MTAVDVHTLLRGIEEGKQARAEQMPTDYDCLRLLGQVYQRLQELGWKNSIYCPKDGTVFEIIEAGRVGIHDCHYTGEWPNGSWWVHDAGDLFPSRPILFRMKAN